MHHRCDRVDEGEGLEQMRLVLQQVGGVGAPERVAHDDGAAHAADVRVEYNSSAQPHLLSVHRFKQIDAWPQQFDIAAFALPAGAAAGQYILHYVWRGYRDCIDLDLLPASLALPDTSDAKYGYEVLQPSQITWSRTDHCQYTSCARHG